ncbi:MAG: hypothetical protein E7321_03965 [Clostridiales bacterium]|nr:hypothetical protein [Clostridiales bacterium]
MTIKLKLPGAKAVFGCAAAACACASWMGAYFGAAWGSMAAFLCCCLLFVLALGLRPTRSEMIACGLSGCVFSVMHTLGYSYDTIDSYGLILKSSKTMLCGALCMLALALVAACVCLLLIRALDHLRAVCARPGEGDARERKQLFVSSAVLIFLGSVPYLLLYAPGLNIFDTHDQLLQFFGYPSYIGDGSALTDHHPVFLTVFYAAFMKLGLVLGDANIGQLVYSLLSMAVLAAAWAYALCALYDLGLKKNVLLVIAAFVALYPVTALYAFNMCKDVSAAPFVLVYLCQMLRIHASEGAVMKDKRFMLAVFANAFALMLMRKPSMYALAFGAVFVIIRYRGVRVRLAAALLGAVMLFHVGYSSWLLPALGVIPGETREMLSIPFQMTARYLNTYPQDVTDGELAAVSRVLDLEAISHYDPRLSDPVKDTSNPDLGNGNLSAYLKAFVSMGMRHPGVYLDAWLNMIYGYFYPSGSNTIVCLTLNSPDEGGMVLRQSEALSDLRLELHDFIYYTLRRLPGAGMLFYVNTISWAFLLLLVYAVLRGGIGEIAPYMFFFGTLGICLLSPKSGEIRYLMPIFYALPIMLGAAILPKKGESKA